MEEEAFDLFVCFFCFFKITIIFLSNKQREKHLKIE